MDEYLKAAELSRGDVRVHPILCRHICQYKLIRTLKEQQFALMKSYYAQKCFATGSKYKPYVAKDPWYSKGIYEGGIQMSTVDDFSSVLRDRAEEVLFKEIYSTISDKQADSMHIQNVYFGNDWQPDEADIAKACVFDDVKWMTANDKATLLTWHYRVFNLCMDVMSQTNKWGVDNTRLSKMVKKRQRLIHYLEALEVLTNPVLDGPPPRRSQKRKAPTRLTAEIKATLDNCEPSPTHKEKEESGYVSPTDTAIEGAPTIPEDYQGCHLSDPTKGSRVFELARLDF